MKIKSVERAGTQPVYDIGVPTKGHTFKLNNGIYASNCFNKSHSLHYSYLTYVCAWLKANYPEEFFASLMTVRSQSQPKKWAAIAPQYLDEAKKLGIEILGPQVNYSDFGFKLLDGKVYFGISAIRDCGEVAAENIIRARADRKFESVKDFVFRVDRQKVNKKAFEALAKAGAFDKMGYHREELVEKAEDIYKYFALTERYIQRLLDIKAQIPEIEAIEKLIEERDILRAIKRKSEYKRNPGEPLNSEQEKRLEELEEMKLRRKTPLKEFEDPRDNFPELKRTKLVPISLSDLMTQATYIGCFIGDHPAHKIFPGTELIIDTVPGAWVETAGIVTKVKEITTRKKQQMAFLEIGDESGMAEVILFPSTYAKLARNKSIPAVNDIVKINGKREEETHDISDDEEEMFARNPKFIANKIEIFKGNL